MEKLRIAAVSTRNLAGQPERSIANMSRWARRAADQGAELIVFPELGVSGYFWSERTWDVAETIPGPSVDRLVRLAEEVKAVLCFGLLERAADVVYNTQLLVGAGGLLGAQRKLHMPGEEYLYWRSGQEAKVHDIGKARVGIAICYDSLFSELCRTFFFLGAEVLIMPYAYSTMARSRFPEENIAALTYRAHCWCNGFWGIAVNNAGTRRKTPPDDRARRFPGWAGVFSPEGKVTAWTRDKGNGEAMVLADLDPEALARRRRNRYFLPRCLRPEIYRMTPSQSTPGAP